MSDIYPRLLYKAGQTCLVHSDHDRAQKLAAGWTLRRDGVSAAGEAPAQVETPDEAPAPARGRRRR